MSLLPLTAFEKYMVQDSHPGYEMTILMEYAFRGKINRDLLIEAYNRVVKFEPLFRAVLVKKGRNFFWDVDDQHQAPLTFETSEKSIEESEGTRYMVTLNPEERCVQIIVREYRDGVAIEIYIHHAVGDGIGVNQFFDDWMKEYDLLLHGITETSTLNFRPDVDLFPRREELHFVPKEKMSFSTKVYDIYHGIEQFFAHRVLPMLKEEKIDKSNLSSTYPMYWRRFGQDFFLKYKAKAKSLGASVNTLMMRDMYITLRKWIEKYPVDDKSVERQNRWFRMLVPINIRTDFHRTIPCANIVGYIFNDKRPVDCDRSEPFLQSIQNNIAKCKKYNSGSTFNKVIKIFHKIPGVMSLMTSDKQCHCSVILSTVGNICKSSQQEDYRTNDDVRIDHDQYPLQLFRMLGAPPTRPHTPISVGVMQRQGEAFISCRYDLNTITEETMLEFYNMFVDEMMKSIEEEQ
ncbi:MAG: hypothetical protein IKX40_08780 [Thermoguttaceae bacterium]|nr:hypothetical protein [Thermoguttaceae bacterium]